MGEVDEALIRVYGQRTRPQATGAVPPGPHWQARGDFSLPPASPSTIDESAEEPSTGEFSRPLIAHPAELVPPAPRHRPAPSPVSLAEIQWPGIVTTLEREWGARFESLADRLIECRDRHDVKVLLFTSCHRAEGRTTLVLTLARALARRPGRILLVDADLNGPMLARQLGLRPVTGLDDVVEHRRPLDEALIEAPDDHLWILPLRAGVMRPREFLASPGWSLVLARLRREFDLVLVDGSPLFTGLNAALLHRPVDAAVLVHNPGITGERGILRAREVLEAGGIPLIGLAETFV